MRRYDIINPSILLGHLPLAEQLDTVVREGFREVELWWPWAVPDPSTADVDAVLRVLDEKGVGLVAMNSYEGGMAEGNRGIACWPDVDREFDASLAVASRVVAETGASGVNVLYGVRRDDEPIEVQDARAAVRMARAAEALDDVGAFMTTEQLSHIPGYGLRTIADVTAAIERARALATRGTILAQLDLFHMFRVGDDVRRYVTESWREIGHVQVADEPGRGGPGTGMQPIDELLDLLEERGYARRIALEYSAYSGDDPFDWMRAAPSSPPVPGVG